jgi:transcriptional regulator with XRE-family HTH domain
MIPREVQIAFRLYIYGDPYEGIPGLIKEEDVSIKELAARAGISKIRVHEYMNGTRVPGRYPASKIAKALGVPETEFFSHIYTGKRGVQYSHPLFSAWREPHNTDDREELTDEDIQHTVQRLV